MLPWHPKSIAVKRAANERLPVAGSRRSVHGEVFVEVVGGYRRVVLAPSTGATRRRGTFFSTSS